MELRGGKRQGPFEYFKWGKYNGKKVQDIIKSDPYYVMTAVKDWLDVSPEQARYFQSLYEGEIPQKYIKSFSPDNSLAEIPCLSSRDVHLYNTNGDIFPNWDFYPEEKPDWVKKYEKEIERIQKEEKTEFIPPSRREELYMKFWKEYFRDERML